MPTEFTLARKVKPFQHLYWSPVWKSIRHERLKASPLCALCLQQGRHTKATVVDHIKPHRGDRHLFFCLSNTQSLCKQCHDSAKKAIEHRGYDRAVGAA